MIGTLRIGRPLKLTLGVTLVAAVLAGYWCTTRALGQDANRPEIFDFHVFYLAGRLILSGHFADAYSARTLWPLEKAFEHGRDVFLPWSYPPSFGLVVAPLAALSPGLAYLAFATGTLALYWATMRRLGGGHFWPVILATAPAMLINLRAGQNGLLTGGLFGLAALCLVKRRPMGAGAAIGCLAIKPHLAPVLPLMLVLQKQWLTLAVAGLTGLALTGLSVAVFGPAVFSAFLAAASQAGHFLAIGAYPLYRMTSVYAFLLSLGAPTALAGALHGLVATVILAWTAWTIHATQDLRVQVGAATMSSAFVSPYFYDYDQTVFAVGMMLLAPTLARAMSANRFGLLLFVIAAGQWLGIAVGALGLSVSPGGPVLLAAYLTVLRFVRLDRVRSSETGLSASHQDRGRPALSGSAA